MPGRKSIRQIPEILFSRVAPGVINVTSIVLLGQTLETGPYGQFSTGLATTAVAVVLAIGPVLHAIVPRHALSVEAGEAKAFEKGVLSLLLVLSAAIATLGITAAAFDWFAVEWALLAGSIALFSGWQPILRARLQFWRFGIMAMANAGVILGLILLSLSSDPDALSAARAFAIGNACGFATGWMLCGAPLPGRVTPDLKRGILGVGTNLTLSNMAENSLLLGMRYVILWFGSPEFLGAFSFALDIAQRSVGVVISITSFVLVPRAYRLGAKGASQKMTSHLLQGAVLSGAVAILVYLGFLGLDASGWSEAVFGPTFSILVFSAICPAIVLNQIKKMAIDPIAIHRGKDRAILTSYLLVAPWAVGTALWATLSGLETAILLICPLAYAAVGALTLAALRRSEVLA